MHPASLHDVNSVEGEHTCVTAYRSIRDNFDPVASLKITLAYDELWSVSVGEVAAPCVIGITARFDGKSIGFYDEFDMDNV